MPKNVYLETKNCGWKSWGFLGVEKLHRKLQLVLHVQGEVHRECQDLVTRNLLQDLVVDGVHVHVPGSQNGPLAQVPDPLLFGRVEFLLQIGKNFVAEFLERAVQCGRVGVVDREYIGRGQSNPVRLFQDFNLAISQVLEVLVEVGESRVSSNPDVFSERAEIIMLKI